MLCFCAAQLKFWFQTDLGRENSASCYRQGRQLLLTFLTMVTRWSRSTSNFYALIGQNLTGEFMRKIYAASWKLFTLTAKADRVLCQLVMFLTIFFHWMYKMKCSCYEESSVIHENCCLVKCFTDLYFFYWLLVVSLAILNAVPFVFSRSWTSLAGVLKMPRVSDAF